MDVMTLSSIDNIEKLVREKSPAANAECVNHSILDPINAVKTRNSTSTAIINFSLNFTTKFDALTLLALF